MRRSILLAVVTALALAIGASATASAVEGGAQATAKKKAAKKKAAKKKAAKCPAKPKKGKKKAACKPKPKQKAGAFKLADGTYKDTKSTTQLYVTEGGKTAKLYTGLSCFVYNSNNVPLTISGNTARASEERDLTIAGEPAHVSWSLTVKSTLDFTLRVSWDLGGGICKSDKTADGKFVKTS